MYDGFHIAPQDHDPLSSPSLTSVHPSPISTTHESFTIPWMLLKEDTLRENPLSNPQPSEIPMQSKKRRWEKTDRCYSASRHSWKQQIADVLCTSQESTEWREESYEQFPIMKNETANRW